MAHLTTPLWNRLTGGLRRQSPRPRRRSGSVLILVVALLVLMALIGTAWISTARTDRYATVQHACKQIKSELQKDVDLRTAVQALERNLAG